VLRRAVTGDAAAMVPWIAAFNRIEGIAVDAAALAGALDRLLAADDLGRAWWIEDGAATVGYAIVTFGFDLEFAGRDAYLTELYLDPAARGRGLGRAAVDAIVAAMPALDVRALHLMVRRDNQPAWAIYQGAGFREPPRAFLTRVIE
jgi:ribosomal protein S18 acetylase RimI-like enzyme